MRRVHWLLVAVVCVLLAVPAGAGAAVYDAISGPGASAAVVLRLNAPVVERADGSGHWRSFAIPGHPIAIRLAPLEDGGGLVAYDQGDAIVVRTWDRDGRLSAPATVLAGVGIAWRGVFDSAEWQLGADGSGTVAIASVTADGHGVVAAVRDPGGAFGTAQRIGEAVVRPPPHAPEATDVTLMYADLAVAPMGAGGAVTVQWEGHEEDGPGIVGGGQGSAQATRPGPGQPFAAATAPAGGADVLHLFAGGAELSAPPVAVFPVASGRPVRVGASVVARCGGAASRCGRPRGFAWGGRRVMLFEDRDARWVVARAGADGVYGHAARVPGAPQGSLPLWTARSGVVAFATTPDDRNTLRLKRIDVLPRAG